MKQYGKFRVDVSPPLPRWITLSYGTSYKTEMHFTEDEVIDLEAILVYIRQELNDKS